MSSTGRGVIRRALDDYQTDPRSVEALLQHVKPFGSFLEPCVGSGNISDAVKPYVRKMDWCEITTGRDFLTWDFGGRRFDWIITNPPFSLAREFIDRSLARADHVAMLLRVNFLESQDRLKWWQSRLPTALYVLANRPGFLTREGTRVLNKQGKPGTDSCAYAWFVWSSRYSGIHVIGNRRAA